MTDNADRPRRERPEGPPADPAEVAAQAEKFLLGLASALGASATANSVIEGDDIEVHLNGTPYDPWGWFGHPKAPVSCDS